MDGSKITGKGLFSNMSKEEFLKSLDDFGITYVLREEGDTRPGYIQYDDDGTIECCLEDEIRRFDSLEDFNKECKRLKLID